MKIILEKLRKEDTSLFYKWWNDEELRTLTSGNYEKMSDKEIDKSIAKHLSDPEYHDFIILADEIPVGHILIKKEKNSKYYALYIAIGEKDYWNKGVGTEAVNQISDWFWQNFPDEKILELEVNKDNPRAKRCYEKVGFHVVAENTYKDSSDKFVMHRKRA